jgi:hypothetical protein
MAWALLLPACAEQSGSVPEVPSEELVADVPELDAIHEFMQPVWHEAFPAQDVEAIAAAVPEFEVTLADLAEAELPGILQDKQDRWDAQKALLMETFDGLKGAVEAGDEDEILAYTEAFHMNYEGMVRIIRPVVPELETFHQHLYAVYHYYGPGYDVEKLRTAASDMAAAIPPLRAAELPARLADHQEHFEMLVDDLGQAVGVLMASLEDPDRGSVEQAIEDVHVAYQEVESIFDSGSHG